MAAATKPMWIHATILAAVTRPRPPIRPSLALISADAIEAKTIATIAAISGHTAHERMARMSATTALLEVGTITGLAGFAIGAGVDSAGQVCGGLAGGGLAGGGLAGGDAGSSWCCSSLMPRTVVAPGFSMQSH